MVADAGQAARPVVIVGMHRCGTSLTARLVGLLGVDLGRSDRLIPAGFDNPRGFWEQDSIHRVNDTLFAILGGRWYRPPEMPADWQVRPEIEALADDARRALDQAGFDRGAAWGWKDPRASLTLPFWRRLMPDMRCLVCIRSPDDVVESLLAREPSTHTRESAAELWVRYTVDALRNSEGLERMLVSYDDLFEDLDRELDRIAAFIGIAPDSIAEEAREDAARFLEPELRHHVTAPAELVASGRTPIEARAIFLALLAARRLDGRPADTPGAAALADGLEALGPALAAVLEGSREASEQEKALEGELGLANDRLVRVEARVESSREEANRMRAELEEMRAELEAERARTERLRNRARRARDGGEPAGPGAHEDAEAITGPDAPPDDA